MGKKGELYLLLDEENRNKQRAQDLRKKLLLIDDGSTQKQPHDPLAKKKGGRPSSLSPTIMGERGAVYLPRKGGLSTPMQREKRKARSSLYPDIPKERGKKKKKSLSQMEKTTKEGKGNPLFPYCSSASSILSYPSLMKLKHSFLLHRRGGEGSLLWGRVSGCFFTERRIALPLQKEEGSSEVSLLCNWVTREEKGFETGGNYLASERRKGSLFGGRYQSNSCISWEGRREKGPFPLLRHPKRRRETGIPIIFP